ncbi:septation regulator SpoVG [Candidatus Gracilibacteria bacterium]|nr:septation regulator SpoVG [Candidatus Gracilibacteria bacterium]
MKITDVRVRIAKSDAEAKLRAYADITFDDSFVIHGLKVIEGKNGMFVAMPSRKMLNGEFKDVAHPITTDVRTSINEAVITKYEEVLKQDPKAEAEEE